jgi:hypothetical protein
MKSTIRSLIALTLALALSSAGCGGLKTAPHLPDLKATSDKDVRASIMYVYGVLQASADVLNSASKLEDDAAKSSPTAVPANVDQAARKLFVDAATQIKTTTQAIDTHAITDWTQIQQRVNPIIDAVNNLAQVAKGASPSSWTNLIGVAVNILMQLLQSGAFSRAPAPAAL